MKIFLVEKNGLLLDHYFHEDRARRAYQQVCNDSNDQEDCVTLRGGSVEIIDKFGVW